MAEDKETTAAAKTNLTRVRLTRNNISVLGGFIALMSLVSILMLIAMDMLSGRDNPYLGILTYIIVPSFLVFGLVLIPVGMLWERRRRRKLAPDQIEPYPHLDLNNPRQRRRLLATVTALIVFLMISAGGSYQAYHYSESVGFCGQVCHTPMKPEFTAYQVSPHARVACVECHVGSGATWYARAKLNGAHQLVGVIFGDYPRPIPTPVKNMRPARETCEQCHWPEKYYGTQMKIFNHYGYDEANTLRQFRLLINVGGGSPTNGPVSGIHWHMNIANDISFISTDDHRQNISYVRQKDRYGNVVEYFGPGAQLTPEQIDSGEKRRMSCIDCHNRPTHIYLSPDQAINDSFSAGKLDVGLPYLKQQSVLALSQPYKSTDEAVGQIAASLDSYYKSKYPDVYANKGESIKQATREVQRIYQTYFFPEMKVNWQTYPNNVGHYYFQGCFRCHDGQHTSKDGKVIRSECNICHTVEGQTEGGRPVATNGTFSHPIDLSDKKWVNCTDCHTGKGLSTH
ncbi:MAG TPA: NapC/NirT family cytochrome c [Blastocatellia bacterium]|nr:NapC/NirT family cytochrome c [Blastocatellia bacterium]